MTTTSDHPCGPLPIVEIARRAGLNDDDYEPYGRFKAKVCLETRERLSDRPNGKYIAVTAITPTPLGEGKTVTTIGLAQALHRLGRRSIACLRQGSLGPTFGLKGGAAGGGRAHLAPLDEVSLHLTGDIHAVGAAHNLLAAALDSHLFYGNALRIDPDSIMLRRVVDMNDRALRQIALAPDGKAGSPRRDSGFDITAASEVMAILALAADHADLRARLGRIVVAFDVDGQPVSAEALGAAGAMAALLKDALLPNLVQTAEGSPALVHAGPFANIAHGNSSIVADQIALKLADYVVTESGFGADLGFEKFVDIKCRASGLAPDCVVLVATVRALKMHGGVGKVVVGRPLPPELEAEHLPSLERGCANLVKQVQNARACGVPVVVAVNAFPTDTPAELDLVRRAALEAGAEGAYRSTVFAEGGAGGRKLAEAVIDASKRPSDFRYYYPLEASIADKVETVARDLYGADGVDFLPAARRQIERFSELGWDRLPVCLAKTQLSLSHDPKLLGAPRGFRLPIRELRASIGAGFLYALCGDIMTMPGLSRQAAFERIDLVGGQVVGLA